MTKQTFPLPGLQWIITRIVPVVTSFLFVACTTQPTAFNPAGVGSATSQKSHPSIPALSVDLPGMDLVFEIDDSRTLPSGEFREGQIHVLALPRSLASNFQDEPIDAFLDGLSPWVEGGSYASLPLGPGDFEVRLGRDEPVWRDWAQAGPWADQFLFLVLDDGGRNESGGEDGRLLVLPLDPAAWENQSAIRFRVEDETIVCVTSFLAVD